MPKTIVLKGAGMRKEAVASSAITPGHLVEFGGSNELEVHGTAAGAARKAFAVESDLIGRGITDAYAQGETVQYEVLPPGVEVYAFLAGGESVSKGDPLVSDGAGALAAMATGEEGSVVAFALEDLDNSGSAAARIQVEVA